MLLARCSDCRVYSEVTEEEGVKDRPYAGLKIFKQKLIVDGEEGELTCIQRHPEQDDFDWHCTLLTDRPCPHCGMEGPHLVNSSLIIKALRELGTNGRAVLE